MYLSSVVNRRDAKYVMGYARVYGNCKREKQS